MWRCVVMTVAGWVCVFLAAVSADSETTVYKKVGDEVVLQPGTPSVTGTITSITWKDGLNIAIEWEGAEIDRYRQFEERGSLNISSGEMIITGLTRDDSGLYSPEINSVFGTPTRLIVISPVPTPTVKKTCNVEETSCTFTCDGNTTDAEPVTYKWMSGDKVLTDSSKEQRITKEDSSSIEEFTCVLENPVSRASSQPIPNPFVTTPESPEPGNLKISAGLTVFITLLAVVLLLVFIHRWKAGMWFFQKESMPWEAGFWSNQERPRRDAAESNGTHAHQDREQTEEETPLS